MPTPVILAGVHRFAHRVRPLTLLVVLGLAVGCPPALAAPQGLTGGPSSAHRGAAGLSSTPRSYRRGPPARAHRVPAYRRYRYATPHRAYGLLRSRARDQIWDLRIRIPGLTAGARPLRPGSRAGGYPGITRPFPVATEPCRLSTRELCVPAGASPGRLELWCDSRHLSFELGTARRPSILACPWSDIGSVWFRSSGQSVLERLDVRACQAGITCTRAGE